MTKENFNHQIIKNLWNRLCDLRTNKSNDTLERWLFSHYSVTDVKALTLNEAYDAVHTLQRWVKNEKKEKATQNNGCRVLPNILEQSKHVKSAYLFPHKSHVENNLVGWIEKTITPDMVGKKIAQFVLIDQIKSKGKVPPSQALFLNRVNGAGGKAVIVNNADDVRGLLR